MKAVVVAPSVRDFYFTPRRDAALGARVVEQELVNDGADVTVTVHSSEGRPRAVGLPHELDYLRRYFIPGETGPVSWFTGYHRFGPEPMQAAARVLGEDPHVVFISSFAWGYSDDAISLAREIRRRRTELPIVIGGHGPTVHPDTFLKPVDAESGGPVFSLIVAGEAEGRSSDILEALSSGHRFVDLRAPRDRAHSRVPDALPAPVCAAPPGGAGSERLSIMLTRGCPCSCDFCANHLSHGRAFRVSPVGNWLPTLKQAVRRWLRPESTFLVNIEDDNVLYIKHEFFEFLKTVRERYPGVRFAAENGLDYRRMSVADVDRFKDLGFIGLNLSLGTFSLSSGEQGARRTDRDRFEAILRRAGELRLPVTTHFICGSAGDSPDNTARTLRYLADQPTLIGISPFYPVPGLPGFNEADCFDGRSPRLALGSSVYPWTGTLDTQSMITAFRLARWLNLRRRSTEGAHVSEPEQELIDQTERTGRLHTLVRRGGRADLQRVPDLNTDLVREALS